MQAFASQRLEVRAPQRAPQALHDVAVGLADRFGMGDAHERIGPGGIQREDLPIQDQGAREVAVFLVVQCQVEQRRDMGGVRRQRALEQQLRGRIAPELGLDDRHVGEHLLGPLDRKVECRLVRLERLVEPATATQEAGEVEARDGILRLAADESPVGGFRLGMTARLLEACGQAEIGGGSRAQALSSASSVAIAPSARPRRSSQARPRAISARFSRLDAARRDSRSPGA